MKTTIESALIALGVEGTFYGEQPSVISDITDAYLNEDIQFNGFTTKRLVVHGGSVTAEQLKLKLIDNEAAENKTHIKQKAGELITTEFPEWQQRNLIARSLELTNKVATGGTLTTLEEQEVADNQARWDWVKQVRETSNAAELANTPVNDVVWPTL